MELVCKWALTLVRCWRTEGTQSCYSFRIPKKDKKNTDFWLTSWWHLLPPRGHQEAALRHSPAPGLGTGSAQEWPLALGRESQDPSGEIWSLQVESKSWREMFFTWMRSSLKSSNSPKIRHNENIGLWSTGTLNDNSPNEPIDQTIKYQQTSQHAEKLHKTFLYCGEILGLKLVFLYCKFEISGACFSICVKSAI